jgi:hypothetical protein
MGCLIALLQRIVDIILHFLFTLQLFDFASWSNCRCQSSHVEMAYWTGVQSNRAVASTIDLFPTLAAKTNGLQEQAEVANHDSRRKV